MAKMMIYRLQPGAVVRGLPCRWQENADPLKECQIVLGCVDSYNARHEVEVTCRRYLMHYLDIGMDLHGKRHGRVATTGNENRRDVGVPCVCSERTKTVVILVSYGPIGKLAGTPDA
jgi:hypothetical protein